MTVTDSTLDRDLAHRADRGRGDRLGTEPDAGLVEGESRAAPAAASSSSCAA